MRLQWSGTLDLHAGLNGESVLKHETPLLTDLVNIL